MDCIQSVYSQFHLMENVLLKVHSDILAAEDEGPVAALLMLELSAAFDIIGHGVLLSRFEHIFGITGQTFNWFESFLLVKNEPKVSS